MRDRRCALKIDGVNDTESHRRGTDLGLMPRGPASAEALTTARRLAAVLRMHGPIVFFDLEATGLDVAEDRIVEISCVRVAADGSARVFDTLVNPGVEVPADAIQVHGISNDDVAAAPTFERIAGEVDRFLAGADLAGYNHGRYDLPLLEHELRRAGIDFGWRRRRLIDVSVIFRRKEPRSLAGALRFYCSGELSAAHTATADVAATMAVLAGQLDRYPELSRDVDALDAFTRPRGPDRTRRS